MDNLGHDFQKILDASARQGGTRTLGTASIRLWEVPMRTVLPEIERAIHLIDARVRDWIRKLVKGESPWPLFLHGPAGTGKTLAALCLLDHCEGGGGRSYYTTPELCWLLIRADRGEEVKACGCCFFNQRDIWSAISGEPVAVLDEIGARTQVSDHHYESVKRYMDYRSGKPTVYISNLGPDDLVKLYDDRVVSRLCAGTVVEVGGTDRRIP